MFFLAAAVLTPASLQAEPPPLEDLVTKIQESYEKAEDLKAGFTQETNIRSIRKVDREEGTVYFKKPKKMLWDYRKPKSKKLVINPQKAWLYVPEDNLVYVQDAKKILNSRLMIRFLTGVGRLKDDFNIRYSEPAVDARGNFVLELTPKTSGAGAGIERLSLMVGKTDYQILACLLRDVYGNVTRVTFSDIRINVHLPDSLFTFVPPAGAVVQTIP